MFWYRKLEILSDQPGSRSSYLLIVSNYPSNVDSTVTVAMIEYPRYWGTHDGDAPAPPMFMQHGMNSASTRTQKYLPAGGRKKRFHSERFAAAAAADWARSPNTHALAPAGVKRS